MVEEKKDKLCCPECGSRQTLLKKTLQILWCRRCGCEFRSTGEITTKGIMEKTSKKTGMINKK